MPIPKSPHELPQFIGISQSKGINTQVPREWIADDEYAWTENFMPLGPGMLRALYGVGTVLYSGTIIYSASFNIGSVQYFAVFLNDGSALQVATVGGATTTIGAAGTFWASGETLPHIAQWGSSGILILSQKGFWAWDTVLWSPGNATSPTWLNGGTATAMPTGLTGTALAIYLSRVFLANGATITFSSPGNGANYATSSGGGTIVSTDSFLKNQWIAMKENLGFLYLIGDSSVNVLSNLQTAGSTTTFNNMNLSEKYGTPWRDSVQIFQSQVLFANPAGIFSVYGGSVLKISDPMDNVFKTISTSFAVSSMVSTLNVVPCYFALIQANDPINNVIKNFLIGFDGKRYFPATQEKTLIQVFSQEFDSILNPWGTDGSSLFPIFSAPSSTLTKTVITKLWAAHSPFIYKRSLRCYGDLADYSGNGVVLNGTIDSESLSTPVALSLSAGSLIFLNASGQALQFQNASGQNIDFTGTSENPVGVDASFSGRRLGLTLSSTSSDFLIGSLGLSYEPSTLYG